MTTNMYVHGYLINAPEENNFTKTCVKELMKGMYYSGKALFIVA